MGDVVFIDPSKHQRNDRVQSLWAQYLNARSKAENSLAIEDGIAAGKAWAAWLSIFTGRAS